WKPLARSGIEGETTSGEVGELRLWPQVLSDGHRLAGQLSDFTTGVAIAHAAHAGIVGAENLNRLDPCLDLDARAFQKRNQTCALAHQVKTRKQLGQSAHAPRK